MMSRVRPVSAGAGAAAEIAVEAGTGGRGGGADFAGLVPVAGSLAGSALMVSDSFSLRRPGSFYDFPDYRAFHSARPTICVGSSYGGKGRYVVSSKRSRDSIRPVRTSTVP